jgi:hypothetical protein
MVNFPGKGTSLVCEAQSQAFRPCNDMGEQVPESTRQPILIRSIRIIYLKEIKQIVRHIVYIFGTDSYGQVEISHVDRQAGRIQEASVKKMGITKMKLSSNYLCSVSINV